MSMTEQANPWVKPPAVMPPPPTQADAVGPMWMPGADVRVGAGLPLTTAPPDIPLWIVGAHGGAGTTTWARLLGGGDAGTSWPTPETGTTNAIVVARTNRTGLQAAQSAAIQWASGTVPRVRLVGLILSADAPGSTPKELRDYQRLISGAYPLVLHAPWNAAWRHTEAWTIPLPRDIAKTIARITKEIQEKDTNS